MPTRSNSQIIAGLVIVLVGFLFLLDNLEILEVRDLLQYWPVLLVALGLARTTSAVGAAGRFVGLVIIAVGALLLLRNLDLIYFRIWEWWPLILILLGGSLLFGARSRTSMPVSTASGPTIVSPDSTLSLFAFMSGYKRTITSDDFRRGDLSAIMGGIEVDLRQASVKTSPAVINTFAFWGGITIRVPADWSVSVQGMPLLGGFDDKTRQPQLPSEKRLVVTGQAIMGGVEITN